MVMVMLMPLLMPNKPSKSEKQIESVMPIKNAGQARVYVAVMLSKSIRR